MSTELQELRARLDRSERRARLSAACALGALALTGLLNLRPAALAQAPGVTLASLVARIAALEQKTAPITVSSDPSIGGANTLLTITGVNVQIVSGSGRTDDGTRNADGTPNREKKLTGLGNLTIGYNATGNDLDPHDERTGSHNLILADQNDYRSFGGLVAGNDNLIRGQYATVTGGVLNEATGNFASVSGGSANAAQGKNATVTGGSFNKATGVSASVSGGEVNTAAGTGDWVGGGGGNLAVGDAASVGGGGASVCGGSANTASNSYASVSGGEGITQTTSGGWSAGGIYPSGGLTHGNFTSP